MEMEKSEKTQTPALTPEELSQRSPTPSTEDEEEVHYVGHLKFSLIFIGLCLSVFQVALVCFLLSLLSLLIGTGRGGAGNCDRDHHRRVPFAAGHWLVWISVLVHGVYIHGEYRGKADIRRTARSSWCLAGCTRCCRSRPSTWALCCCSRSDRSSAQQLLTRLP